MTHHEHGGEHRGDHSKHYIKIWGILCVLLVASVVGPMLGHKLVTILTAFGIAIVKAWMVASYFMHLNIEKKYVSMLLLTMLLAVMLFWVAVAPDVMKHEGQRWVNESAKEHVEKGLEAGEHEEPAHH